MNNSNICPIVYSNITNINNDINNSLEFYKKETKEHVIKYLGTGILFSKKNSTKNPKNETKIKKIISYILSNDDMFSNMMTAIMLADFSYNKTGGSLRYWRTKNCLWTLNKTLYKNKIRLNTISDAHTQADSDIVYNSQSEPTTEHTPLDEALKKEEYSLLDIKIDSLEKREREIIQLYYMDNMNEQQIAKRYSISQQRVSKILINARKRFKNERNTK